MKMAEHAKGKAPVIVKTESAGASDVQKDMVEQNLSTSSNVTTPPVKRFYRIMSVHSNWHKMKLPPKFVRRYGKDIALATTATLVVPSGRSWTTNVTHEEDDVYLKRGWEEFLKDNLVKEYEMLTFAYLGNMKFLVQVCALSGLEKMSVNNPEKMETSPVVKTTFDIGKCEQKSNSGKTEQKKMKKEEETDAAILLPVPEKKKPNPLLKNNSNIVEKSDSSKKKQKKLNREKETDAVVEIPHGQDPT